MDEKQFVVQRRRIYYDQHDNEILIYSDNKENLLEDEEEKHEFFKDEDHILWMVFHENELDKEIRRIKTLAIVLTFKCLQQDKPWMSFWMNSKKFKVAMKMPKEDTTLETIAALQ